MKYTVEYDLGMCGGCFDIEADNDHQAHKIFFDLLEDEGLSLDDVDSFSITCFDLPDNIGRP